MFCIKPLKQNNIRFIEKILDEAFGTDRWQKTAYRLREGVLPVAELSFAGFVDERLMASLQFWRVHIKEDGKIFDALLLGPIAVDKQFRGQGYGLKLMDHGLRQARERGHERVILVGDEVYYRKVGFCRALATGLDLPGPVDPDRLLARALTPGAMDGIKGMISRI